MVKRIVLPLLLILLITACSSQPENNIQVTSGNYQSVAPVSLTPRAGSPDGQFVTWRSGENVALVVGNISLISNVDGIGPRGVSIRGVSNYLQIGDPLQRQVNGRTLEFGYLADSNVYANEITMYLYNQAIEIP